MKRQLAQGILISLLWVYGVAAAAGTVCTSGAEVSLKWPVTDLKTGQQIAVELWARTGGNAFGCYEADVQFDPQALMLRSVQGGTANFFQRTPAVAPRAFDTGHVRLVAYQGENLASSGAEGHVATMLFGVQRDGSVTASRLGLTGARAWDTSGQPISLALSPQYGDVITLADTLVEADAMPSVYALGPVFPNPFNTSAVITFTLPENGHVRLDAYSMLGQRMDTLIDTWTSAGLHTVRWDASDLAGGVYLLRLQAGGWIGIRKAVLLR